MDFQVLLTEISNHWIQIDEQTTCENALIHFWLFRLLPYIKLYSNDNIFWTFTEILDLYDFDRRLRKVIWELVEHIEIDIKTKLVEETTDINWKAEHLDWTYMNNPQKMEEILTGIIESRKENIKSVSNPDPTRLTTDFWKIIRVCSFWDMWKILKELNSIKLRDIVNYYNIPMQKSIQTFLSRTTSLRKVRNVWWHHEICLKNPWYLRIFSPSSTNWSRDLFPHIEVLLIMNKAIDQVKMIELRDKLIELIKEWDRWYAIDILKIIWAPESWEEILMNI